MNTSTGSHEPRSSHELTVDGARAAADRDDLAGWVEEFLSSDGSDNRDLGEELSARKDSWYGPVELPFDELHRLVGPEDQPTIDRLTDDDVETVESMRASIEDGWEPAPLVVSINGPQTVVEDGNHRIEGLRRAGRTHYWAVVGFDDDEQRSRFLDDHAD